MFLMFFGPVIPNLSLGIRLDVYRDLALQASDGNSLQASVHRVVRNDQDPQ